MKKIISVLLALLMLVCVNVSAENPITVEVDFGTIQFDTPPVNINGRVLVPVRAIFEAMGAEVTWNAGTKTVTSKLDNNIVVMQIDSTIMRINGEPKTIDVAPKIISNRTLVPARAAAEAFDCKVQWLGPQNKVVISTKAFTEKLKTKQSYSSVRKLELGEIESVSAFNLSYLAYKSPIPSSCIALQYIWYIPSLSKTDTVPKINTFIPSFGIKFKLVV